MPDGLSCRGWTIRETPGLVKPELPPRLGAALRYFAGSFFFAGAAFAAALATLRTL